MGRGKRGKRAKNRHVHHHTGIGAPTPESQSPADAGLVQGFTIAADIPEPDEVQTPDLHVAPAPAFELAAQPQPAEAAQTPLNILLDELEDDLSPQADRRRIEAYADACQEADRNGLERPLYCERLEQSCRRALDFDGADYFDIPEEVLQADLRYISSRLANDNEGQAMVSNFFRMSKERQALAPRRN